MHKANVDAHHDPRRQPDTKAIIDMAWMKRPRITDRCSPYRACSDDHGVLCSLTMRPCVQVDIRPADCL
ncbi:hypothetical protein N7519_003983 [Penicillium mononematosum]|uniref:uncharacterized protein n=1 Tax=Penicillium mononematosum TaxID=268346 RepID=UPI002549A782|nr:uncharacterized protein N7519_003983 [Penicillium mononematosum]KAJ6189075.1 hypothetical protein N7519_003983 [Penicillium mononematosum]